MTLERFIGSEETIKSEFGVSNKIITFELIIGIIFLIAGIGIFFILHALYIKYSVKYGVTNKGAISKRGLIGSHVVTANYDKITDITFTQGILGRIFKIGTIHINTAGTHLHEIQFKSIDNPLDVKRELESHMHK